MSTGGAGRRDDRGAATLLTLAMAGVLLFVTAALGVVGGLVVAQRGSQAAADLAALAGASAIQQQRDACAAASEVATANGGRLVDCAVSGQEVLVQVRVAGPAPAGRSFHLTARSRAGPGP
jgi:secretion/DNA translocation related TadE-like protein